MRCLRRMSVRLVALIGRRRNARRRRKQKRQVFAALLRLSVRLAVSRLTVGVGLPAVTLLPIWVILLAAVCGRAVRVAVNRLLGRRLAVCGLRRALLPVALLSVPLLLAVIKLPELLPLIIRRLPIPLLNILVGLLSVSVLIVLRLLRLRGRRLGLPVPGLSKVIRLLPVPLLLRLAVSVIIALRLAVTLLVLRRRRRLRLAVALLRRLLPVCGVRSALPVTLLIILLRRRLRRLAVHRLSLRAVKRLAVRRPGRAAVLRALVPKIVGRVVLPAKVGVIKLVKVVIHVNASAHLSNIGLNTLIT